MCTPISPCTRSCTRRRLGLGLARGVGGGADDPHGHAASRRDDRRTSRVSLAYSLRSYFRIKNRFTRCDWDLVLHILFSGPGWLLPSCVLTMSPGSCGLRPLVQPARGHQHHGSRSSQHGLGPSLSIRSLGWAILLVRPPWAASTTKRREELLADVNSAHDGHFLLILLLVLVLTNPEIPPAHFLYEASGVAIGSARAR